MLCAAGCSDESANTEPAITDPVVENVCGDGVIGIGESCDKTTLGDKTCQSWPEFLGGILSCNASCEFDKSGCVECTDQDMSHCKDGQMCQSGHCTETGHNVSCGDNVAENAEECDGIDLRGKSCADINGYVDGSLKCSQCKYDISSCIECTEQNLSRCANGQVCPNGRCVEPGHVVSCGDNMAEGSEECDGNDLHGKSCANFEGFGAGTLQCHQCSFDTSGCVECTEDSHCANRSDGKTHCESTICTKPADVPVPPSDAKVVISQIYTGGGNSGAIYNTKYIELLNIGNSEADVSGWSVQYGVNNKETVTTTICKLPSTTKIPKGGYYLIGVQKGENGSDIIAPDHTCSSLAPAASKGKLFLVNNSNALVTSLPESGYIDAVGYGSANWAEGNNPMPALSATTAGFRKEGGCIDTNNNGNDFEVAAPAPRNSKSPLNLCNGSQPQPPTPTCGNGKLDSGEDCDGKLFVGNKTTCNSWNSNYIDGNVSCNACTIDYSGCTQKPQTSCGNGKLDSGEDCDGKLFVGNKTTCNSWNSSYIDGNVSCNACTVNYSACQKAECSDNEVECSEKELSLKKCVGGKWKLEKCPDDKPYCKDGAKACSAIKKGDKCQTDSFIPFTRNGSLYFCDGDGSYYSTTFPYSNVSGNVKILSCSTSGGECMTAQTGIGVNIDKASSCSILGSAHVTEKIRSSNTIVCTKCMPNQDGELYDLIVPAYFITSLYDYRDIQDCEPKD